MTQGALSVFYGNFSDPGDQEFFRTALSRFQRIFGSIFAADNLMMFQRTLGHQRDRRFMQVLEARARTRQERSLELRLNTLVWAAKHALHVPGDFVECGVWRGFCSSVIVDYLDFTTVAKKFYLYDSFSGIPAGFDSEGHDHPAFAEPGLYEKVCGLFAQYGNVVVVRGAVPASFAEALPEQVAFLHLDMNSSKSEIAALEVLFDRVSPGGVIVFDDYGWLAYRAQQLAEDAFAAERGYAILEMPTGQGLLLKR
jgi:O-methyltransferase